MHRRRFFGVLAGAVAAIALQLDPPRREKSVRDLLGEWFGRKRQADILKQMQAQYYPPLPGTMYLVIVDSATGKYGIYPYNSQSSDASLPAA